MTMPALPRIPPPLAQNAATAVRAAGNCAICTRPIAARDRYAALVPSGRFAHVPCVSRLALRTRQRTIIR